MSQANRFIKDLIYGLKRVYGQPVDLYLRTAATMNPSTGRVSVTESKHSIKKVPVIPGDQSEHFKYDLSFIAANKNFTYGGVFDLTKRTLLIDAIDLPRNYVPNLTDAFVIEEKRFQIKSITDYNQKRSYVYVVEWLRNQKIDPIQTVKDNLYLEETLESTLE